MTFDPKTFITDVAAAQHWLEKELNFEPGPGKYPPGIRFSTGWLHQPATAEIVNSIMTDTVKVSGVDLLDMVAEMKRRLGYEDKQLKKAGLLQIEGKTNE